MLKNILLVGLGGAIGSVGRYIFSLLITSKNFPLNTFIVNALGCFAIGIFLALSIKNEESFTNWKLFLTTGICGGFTTFSAFAIENVQLLQSGKTFTAITYILLSIVIGILTAFLGFKLISING
jgi:fluoride exporter